MRYHVLPPSTCSLQAPDPRSYFAYPPSKVVPATTSITLLLVLVLVEVVVGSPPVYPRQARVEGSKAMRLISLSEECMLGYDW